MGLLALALLVVLLALLLLPLSVWDMLLIAVLVLIFAELGR